MRKRVQTIGLSRLFWPLVLGLGLTLGLLGAMTSRSTAEALDGAMSTRLRAEVPPASGRVFAGVSPGLALGAGASPDPSGRTYSPRGVDELGSGARQASTAFQGLSLVLRVNYGHDWVESNYEAGHTVWITVTDSGGTVKATAEVATGVVPWWGGETGFSTGWQDWSPGQPDIVPGDWVYGRVDNGHTSTVRVGTIDGTLDLVNDTVSGNVHANWFAQALHAHCGVWEENGPGLDFSVDPNGGTYFCDFSAEWDLRPGQDVAVEYQEPDGDQVINIFREPSPAVRVNQSHNWVDGETKPGSTIVATVWRGGLPVLSRATHSGDNTWWNINFCCEDESELRTGDVVEVQTSYGVTASVEIIPMSGVVDASADAISGQLSGVPLPARVRGEVWTENGPSVAGWTDDAGHYALDFSPFDVLAGHYVALWYVRPDGHQVGIVGQALRLEVDTGCDRVEGGTAPGLPVTVTVNSSETMTATSDANGHFNLEFGGDIAASDTVEAWAGTRYASLVVVPVSASIDDANDVVWGYGPPNRSLNVGVNGDWREISTDGSGSYKVQYEWDMAPDDEVEVCANYPAGHQTRHRFGPSDVRVSQDLPIGNVVPGDEYSYLIEYSNDANGPATDVVLTDTLPGAVTYLWDASGVTPTFDARSNTLVWHLGALGAYRSRRFELRVRLDTSAPRDISLRNDVRIGDPGDCDPGNNRSETDVWSSDPRVDLWVEKSLQAGLPVAGEVITYQICYGNSGNRAARDVLLTDTLPTGTAFVATTFEEEGDGATEQVGAAAVTWEIGVLDPGESRQFELAVRIDGSALSGTLLASEAVVGGDREDEPQNNRFRHTVTVEPLAADLWVSGEIEGDLAAVENEVLYRITYRNDGPLAARDVVVTHTLPLSMTHLWHNAGSAAVLTGGEIVWQLGTVPAGSGGQLLASARVSGTVLAGTVFTHTVKASARVPELDEANNRATDVLGPPRVICVPWAGARPHRVWPGLATTLKGTAKGHGLTAFAWDPGDGSPIVTGMVDDPYVIEASHAYSAPVGTIYTATLTVWGAFGWSGADTYVVKVFAPTLGVQVGAAVDEGLWYIHKRAHRYTSGGLPFAGWDSVADTVSAIQAFQVQGHRPGGDLGEDPYVEDVQRGWNELFAAAQVDAMALQPAGDPDGDGDGIGIGVYEYYGHAVYESGLAMMALATTGSPGQVARTGPPVHVRGQTYYSITQDMADWFAWGQNDDWSDWARGGWRYQPNSGDSDNSNTQFPVLGLAAAEENWGIAVPAWVKDELRDYWLAYTQDGSGGFGYSGPGDWVNVGKTGAGIMDLAWAGVPVTDTRIASAARFIETHWNDAPDGNWNGNLGELYAMYAVKKGSQLAGIHSYGPHIWGHEYASYLVGVQGPDGRFEGAGNMAGWQPMDTSWAVMILSPGLYQALPAPVIPPILYGDLEGKVLFDVSASYHTDPDGRIVLFEWDFGDGSPVVTATSPVVTHTYLARGIYLATMTVWDDAGHYAAGAARVNVTAPDGQPVADPGGPYAGQPGQGIVLDGSGSHDPDERIGDAVVLYEWDVVGDRVYTTTEPTLTYTGTVPGTLSIALRVRDRGTDYGLDSPRWSEPATTTLTLGGLEPPGPTAAPTRPDKARPAVATATPAGEQPSSPESKEAGWPVWAFAVAILIAVIVVVIVIILLVARSARRR